jgi:hypothetical protein
VLSRDTTRIGEDDYVTARTGDSDVALMSDSYRHAFRLLVVVPLDPWMSEVHPIKTPPGGVYDHDLVEEARSEPLDCIKSVREAWLVLADDDQGDLHDPAEYLCCRTPRCACHPRL